MGCDIHAHLEIKVNNKWHYYAPINIQRNYKLFSKMANVRSYPDAPAPIATPRGIPDNISDTTQLHHNYWAGDGHSHSWLNSDELCDLIDWYDTEFPADDFMKEWRWTGLGVWLFGNTIRGFKEYPGDQPSFLQDIRLIFWFDN